KPLVDFGSALIVVIPFSFSLARKAPMDFELAVGLTISSFCFVSVKFLQSLFNWFVLDYNFPQGANHRRRVLVLEDIAAESHTLCSCRHCAGTHLQYFAVRVGLGSSCDHYRHRAALYYSFERVDIARIHGLYDISSCLCAHSCGMGHDFRFVRVLDILSPWIHHCYKWFTPFRALVSNHSQFL